MRKEGLLASALIIALFFVALAIVLAYRSTLDGMLPEVIVGRDVLFWILGILTVLSAGALLFFGIRKAGDAPCLSDYGIPQIKLYSLILLGFCLLLSVSSFLVGKRFVVIPYDDMGKIERIYMSGLLGTAVSLAIILIAVALFLGLAPFLSKAGKVGLILPLASVLIGENCLKAVFLAFLSRYQQPYDVLVAIVLDSLTLGWIAFVLFRKGTHSLELAKALALDNPQLKLGQEIREARIRKGLSQTQLGRLVYVDRSSISRYESGLALPSEETLDRLSAVLDQEFDASF